jgi:hypothetical protein
MPRDRPGAHRGLTVSDLAEPGYGRTLGEKVISFAVVLLISGLHAPGHGPRPLKAEGSEDVQPDREDPAEGKQ